MDNGPFVAYDRLWQQGREALRHGALRFERPLGSDTSGRWGVSMSLWPEPALARRLAVLSSELASVVGPHCWSHDEHSLHFTVRALEPYRSAIPDGDRRIRLYGEALAETAALGEPVRLALVGLTLALVGLTLAPNGVLVCGVPVDGAAQRLRERLGKALSVRGVDDLESDLSRDTWHATLLHFTGPPAEPEALLRWVEARRRRDLGTAVPNRMVLSRSGYDECRVRLYPLRTARLTDPRVSEG